MTLRETLAQLARAGARVRTAGDRLAVSAPDEVLTSAVMAALQAWKGDLLARFDDTALRDAFGIPAAVSIAPDLAVLIAWYRAELDAGPVELREAWVERAAITESNGGIPRWQAELLAADEICAVSLRTTLPGAAEAQAA